MKASSSTSKTRKSALSDAIQSYTRATLLLELSLVLTTLSPTLKLYPELPSGVFARLSKITF